MSRYYARSASDKTSDWPFWLIADEARGGLNVTGPVLDKLGITRRPGGVFMEAWDAIKAAGSANRELSK